MRHATKILLIVIAAVAMMGASYTPIPNESGAQFRSDINARLSGAAPISPALTTNTYTAASVNVGPANGVVYNCNATSNNVQFFVPKGTGSGIFYTFKK